MNSPIPTVSTIFSLYGSRTQIRLKPSGNETKKAVINLFGGYGRYINLIKHSKKKD